MHHLQARAKNGSHETSNLITLCSAHHSAIHDGRLHTEGNADAVRFVHANGQAYGDIQAAPVAALHAKVSAGLRGLGFREGEVRAAMTELREREALREASAEQWLREALLLLHRPQHHGPH